MQDSLVSASKSKKRRGLAQALAYAEGLRRSVLGRRSDHQAPRLSRPLSIPARPHSVPSRYLAIAAIFKNESSYLAEWLEFHRIVGVEHAFLYDNGSTDEPLSVLAPFIAQGFVTLVPWASFDASSPFSVQSLQYAHALTNFGPDYRWMVNLDIDEFLVPVQGDDLKTVLSAYEDLPSIAVPLTMYGFCVHETKPDGLVIENYTMRAPFPPARKRKGIFKWKAVLDPAEVVAIYSPHAYDFRSGLFGGGFDENRKPISNATRYDFPRTANVLRINHYTTSSKSEFTAKLEISTAGRESEDAKRGRRLKFATWSNLDAVHDPAILRFVPRLKQTLGAKP